MSSLYTGTLHLIKGTTQSAPACGNRSMGACGVSRKDFLEGVAMGHRVCKRCLARANRLVTARSVASPRATSAQTSRRPSPSIRNQLLGYAMAHGCLVAVVDGYIHAVGTDAEMLAKIEGAVVMGADEAALNAE